MANSLPGNLAIHLKLALDNMGLAGLVCSYQIDQHKYHTPIPTEVFMRGVREGVHIPGENCGFFSTPITHTAVLDVRRSLDFLMLRIDKGVLVNFTKKKWDDDWSILDLGINAPTPDQMKALSMQITGKYPEGFLSEMVSYANKGLAHFSTKNEYPDFNSIVDACALMKEALLTFIYDSLAVTRPRLQPGTIDAI
jgi:hypothetical protein